MTKKLEIKTCLNCRHVNVPDKPDGSLPRPCNTCDTDCKNWNNDIMIMPGEIRE